jgi:predicted nuclease of predicted toxin-antitoxin system
MKFLLNMNVPRELGRLLSQAGHEIRHVGDIGLSSAEDALVVDVARDSGEVIVTHDLDYGELIMFAESASPSVIIIRLNNISSQSIMTRLTTVWDQIKAPLAEGAIVSISERAVRVRRLS